MLYEHPAVREAAVVGVPDEYRGETVKAFVSLRPGTSADRGRAHRVLPQRLAAYKYPRLVEIVDELPKTAPARSCAASCAAAERDVLACGVSPRRGSPRGRAEQVPKDEVVRGLEVDAGEVGDLPGITAVDGGQDLPVLLVQVLTSPMTSRCR